MEGVKYKNQNTNPTIKGDSDYYEIAFKKDKCYFMILENYVKFIKGCEKLVRTHPKYTEYISNLKAIGLTNCQILGNVHDNGKDKDATVEMHHGPLFTLFDYCGCLINHMLLNEELKDQITTYRIAEIILDEHFNGNIQTVNLSKTIHQLIDSNKMFINFKQAQGNLSGFIKKYGDGLSGPQKEKVDAFIELCRLNKSTDNRLLELKESMYDWSNRRACV